MALVKFGIFICLLNCIMAKTIRFEAIQNNRTVFRKVINWSFWKSKLGFYFSLNSLNSNVISYDEIREWHAFYFYAR